MTSVALRPIDQRGPPIHLPLGKTTVGRGPFLGCTDKRISRNHAVLEVTNEGKVTLTPIHSNPCFRTNGNADLKPFTKDVAHSLSSGDRFSMLPSAYEYEVVISTKNSGQDKDTNTNTHHPAKSQVNESAVNLVDTDEPTQPSRRINSPVDERTSPVKDPTTTTNRVKIAEKKASAFLDSDETPSTSSKPSNRKRVLPVWLIDAAEQQGNFKQDKSTPKRTPPAKTKPNNKQDSGGDRSKTKQPSASKGTTKPPVSSSSTEKKTNIANKANNIKKADVKRPNYDMSDESDDGGLPSNKTKVQPSVKNVKPNYDMSDEESDDNVRRDTTKDKKTYVPKKKNRCTFGAKCYRKNPAHFQEFSHPGDDDYDSEPDVGDRGGDDSDDSRPECEFGLSCYRKNPQHRKDYKHTAQRQPPRAAAKKAKAKVRRHNDDSDDDNDSSNDSFIDDDSDDYKPESGEDSDEDPSRLLAEAEKFKRNKNLLKPV